MMPQDFIAKWKKGGDERRDFQPFFEDLCRMLGQKTPREADPEHEWFTYEYGASKTSGGNGWADVWRKGRFGWEAKGTHKDLAKAYQQLKMYADALENPPLLIVSDLQRFEIHTNFTATPKKVYAFTVEDLAEPATRRLLSVAFDDPQQLKPGTTRAAITEEAAGLFAALAEALRKRGHDPHVVAHFLNRLLFCMFAEDIGLLPEHIFARLVDTSQGAPDKFEARTRDLFTAMKGGGDFALNTIEWFNGGLFENDTTLRLETPELKTLQAAAKLDWSEIDPSIFGTLFERGLDPAKRSQLGAHYTDPATIAKIVRPVVVEPLAAEWETEKAAIAELMKKADIFKESDAGETGPAATLTLADKKAVAKKHTAQKTVQTKALNEATARLRTFLERLRAFVVLDPACGSGNFLFMALRALKDLEKRVMFEAETLGLPRQVPSIGPANVRGIELNEYAAELARITVWIGEIQWMIQNGFGARRNPILQSLGGIENRDALVNPDGSEAQWPRADAIVGNPPFIGDKKMVGELGAEYTAKVRKAYVGRVPGGADFVCYWFEKANDAVAAGTAQRAGLVSTNSIRGGANREVLKHAIATTRIFEAWDDEEWWDNGAAVRVSLTCYGHSKQGAKLNGKPVGEIFADLTEGGGESGNADLTKAKGIPQNFGISFQGVTPSASLQRKRREELGLPEASFNLEGDVARAILRDPSNVRGEPMADVVRPYLIADDITARPLDRFIVNFGGRDELSASMFEKPFSAITNVRLHRAHARRNAGYPWWLLLWPRPVMFKALRKFSRFIAIPRVSKHHLCVWKPCSVVPGDALVVVARDDDTSLGILQSKIHEKWALRQGTNLGVGNDPRYTHKTSFETFPFPEGLTPNISASDYADNEHAKAIAKAAKALVEARDRWLNPAEWVDWQRTPEEEAAGFPLRPVPKKGHEAALKKRTLTNLYNERPAWLANLHKALDEAVAAAYDWEWPLTDDEILRRLFALNQYRAGV